MTNNHVMVDLETMSIGPRAVIMAIGAVQFDPALGPDQPMEGFYAAVDLQSCLKAGLQVDGSTMMYWLHPESAAARDRWYGEEHVDLTDALDGLTKWLPPEPKVWGNGAAFDNVILANAFYATGTPVPWGYSSDRCFRTLKATVDRENYDGAAKATPVVLKHHALEDARWQAQVLLRIARVAQLELK